ncbi:HigA family addiction module antitoxin [soil metagenome]
MRKSSKPAEVFPPGDFIREELQARKWTQGDLARILGRPLQTVNQIINGNKRITAETAKELGMAFGTGPELWLNLENAYRLSIAPEPDQAIATRAMAMA